MLTFILFILILSVLVLIHEFGHFYFAKRAGVKVEEFGFGLPPKVYGKKVGETEYTLNLLPFGGFVRLLGEDDMNEKTIQTGEHDPKNYLAKSPLQKLSILGAGIMMNTFLAIALYYMFFMFSGFRSFAIPNFFDYNFKFGNVQTLNTVTFGFGENSPALDAGLHIGEAILEVDGQAVYSVPEFKEALKDKADQDVNLLVMDVSTLQRPIRNIVVKPVSTEDGDVVVGIYMSKSTVLDYNSSKLLSAPMHTYNVFSYSISTMGELIKSSFATKSVEPVSSSFSGPVGIISVVGNIVNATSVTETSAQRSTRIFLSLVDLTALLSISLAFVNALPLPALDGGRIFIVLVEVVRGKKVSPKFEAAYHQTGMLFLLGLLVLITIKDVLNLF